MFVPLLVLIIAFAGLAVDMGALYNRKVELSGMAKAVALAAARELNGKPDGIAAALVKAKETAERFTYRYGAPVTWDNAALKFGTSPSRSGGWVDAAAVPDPSSYYFVKVDTSGLGAEVATVGTWFMPVLSESLRTVELADSAVAGRAAIDAVPLAVCAMSDQEAAERVNPGLGSSELVEYGFRRGVSYDLMQLNPKGTAPARYLINPVSAPGMSGASFDTSIIGSFMCPGTMWIPRLTGGSIHVSSLPPASPLASLHTQLNSRFDDYGQGACAPSGAPPDINIKAFAYDSAGGAPWMSPATGSPAALPTTERGKLETVADIPPPGSTLPTLTPGAYGPLWSYARAAKYAAFTQGVPEPNNGYPTFGTGDWGKLYLSGPAAAGYPNGSPRSTPYNPIGTANPATVLAPSASRKEFATQFRRMLHVPLLSCAGAVPTGAHTTATIVGIGKFFMTVPATQDRLIAEFAGSAPEQSIPGAVELYP